MTFVSLFAGIGGIDLGLERAGMRCVGQVEIDPYATRVLEKHWPNVPRHGDVRTFHGTEFGPFDLLTGGYPCQPFSLAGARAGEHDERHLWPEVLRIIRNVRPRLVLLENVPGHLSLGFGRVLGDLAESGYDAEWDCIPAAAVGAPHLRDRVWIVAHTSSERLRVLTGGAARQNIERYLAEVQSGRNAVTPWADATGIAGPPSAFVQWAGGLGSPDGVPNRVDRLRTLGNAVVPQVAEHIGRRLMEAFA